MGGALASAMAISPTYPSTAHPPATPCACNCANNCCICRLRAQSRFAGGGSATRVSPRTCTRGSAGHGTSQATASSGATPCLFGSAAIFTSMQTCKGGISSGTLIAQALRRFQALDGVHPMRASATCRVLLDCTLADNTPHNIGAIGQLMGLSRPFLSIVFAEISLAGSIYCADIGGGKRFAHRHQRHAAGGAAGSGFGRRDGGFNLLVIVLQDLISALSLRPSEKIIDFSLGWNVFTYLKYTSFLYFNKNSTPKNGITLCKLPTDSPSASRTRPPTCTSPPACRR